MMGINNDNSATGNGAIPLKGFEYVEVYVGNASHAAHYYRTTLGFAPVAYAGLETGARDRVSYLLAQGNIVLLLTAATSPDSPVAEHVLLHGDSVKDIAFSVEDAARAFDTAVERGATPVAEPTVFETDTGRVTKATIATFGHTVHSFVQRDDTRSPIFPPYQPVASPQTVRPAGLTEIDHVAISVGSGEMDRWVAFYEDVMGFHQSHHQDVATERSAMHSKVVEDETGAVKFPIMEPAPGKGRSQIEEYLAFHKGAGAQHVALLSENIVETVRVMRENSIEFLRTPDVYYSMLEDRVGRINEDVGALHELNILADRDHWGYLLQIFTKPVQSRPTLFLEVIQRVGARGFGGGNVEALFKALEHEQAMRGNL
jgi:4-hydroxyphenylpyruvate dioxygenase